MFSSLLLLVNPLVATLKLQRRNFEILPHKPSLQIYKGSRLLIHFLQTDSAHLCVFVTFGIVGEEVVRRGRPPEQVQPKW